MEALGAHDRNEEHGWGSDMAMICEFGLTLLTETETLNDTGRTTTSNEAGS